VGKEKKERSPRSLRPGPGRPVGKKEGCVKGGRGCRGGKGGAPPGKVDARDCGVGGGGDDLRQPPAKKSCMLEGQPASASMSPGPVPQRKKGKPVPRKGKGGRAYVFPGCVVWGSLGGPEGERWQEGKKRSPCQGPPKIPADSVTNGEKRTGLRKALLKANLGPR